MTSLCRISSIEFILRWCQGLPRLRRMTLGSWMNELVRRRDYVAWEEVFMQEEETVERIISTLLIPHKKQRHVLGKLAEYGDVAGSRVRSARGRAALDG